VQERDRLDREIENLTKGITPAGRYEAFF